MIEQTTGVLIRMYGVTAEQAFKVLVRCSQETSTTPRLAYCTTT
ncbi:AmiR/NasT family two-component response regulator [Nocardia transvalensis]|uniref:AmiR/NasT family two-component response regulator n=1 Tax=Nocardia transvalensis TaxID=37333 RepID=A0A7W9PIE7_9NOCA|nr:ANTAR domain-containing protein [Nocardia transvalensis]MBB5916749.1 AmiR/NasT family two-component response regulator [Nocardia transvalensis]